MRCPGNMCSLLVLLTRLGLSWEKTTFSLNFILLLVLLSGHEEEKSGFFVKIETAPPRTPGRSPQLGVVQADWKVFIVFLQRAEQGFRTRPGEGAGAGPEGR